MTEVRAMSRAGRENQILIALYLQYDRHKVNGGTAYDIATKIGMRPTSPRFRDILNGMVENGKLIKMEVKSSKRGVLKHGASGCYWYSVPEPEVSRKKDTERRIEEARRTKNSLQLRLFS